MADETDFAAKLNVLHDHYKDSFSHIREWEKQRDRQFLIVVGIIGALFFEALYPTNLQKALEHASDQTAGINVSAFPMHALISVTWTLLAVFALRYCQALTHIERQYEYLHSLEDKIAPYFSDQKNDRAYRREGRKYLKTRTIFSNWARFFYTFIFPVIIVTATGGFFYIEIMKTGAPLYHFIYDGLAGFTVWLSFAYYKRAQWADARSAKRPRVAR